MRLFKTWEETKKVPQNGRLVWYTGAADVEHWAQSIAEWDVAALLTRARRGEYSHRTLLLRFLPKDRPILDGGCSVGAIVTGLQADGYDAVGIDWSSQIVERAKSIAPDLNIHVGDVLNVPYPDGHFGGYVSLGIVEHFLEGPDRALAEANRVLSTGGCLILSVPYFSRVRQFKARWKLYPKPPTPPDPGDFYQYAFSEREMADLLRKHGFEVQVVDYSEVLIGVGRELGVVGEKLRRGKRTASMIGRGERLRVLRRLIGHSIIFVAKKARSIATT